MWFRRDLRRNDNPALLAAAEAARGAGVGLAAVFVFDPRLVSTSGPNRVAFLTRSLAALRTAGVPMILRTGDPTIEIPRLAEEIDARNVFCAADFAPYGRARDERVHATLEASGRRLCAVGGPYAVSPGTLSTRAASPFRVFTPFHHAWLEQIEGIGPEAAFDPAGVDWRENVRSDPLPAEPGGVAPDLPEAGEMAALERWRRFEHDRLDDYAELRNHPCAEGTSRLSVDLKFGALHPRQLLLRLAGAQKGTGRWVFRSELAWREFYADVLWHRPDTATHNFLASMDAMRVDTGPLADQRFKAWTQGRTGFPFIDAGMRQLLTEGWMHNRVRMAVASFLVKDLHVPWQRGAKWFMEHLVDGDLASNQHGWQWTAGTGTDAAPYFRVFNPTTQGRTFDPDGTYIRRYVSELTDYAGDVHLPASRGGASLFDDSPGYPAPIVDHATERVEALARLGELRS